MKSLFSLLLFVLVLSSCKKKENPYKLEDQLYNCINQSNTTNGIAYKAGIDSIQKIFVEAKILKDYSGKSLYTIFEKMLADNDYPSCALTESQLNSIESTQIQNAVNFCQNNDSLLDTDTKSKVYLLNKRFKDITDNYPKDIAGVILNTLTVNDLEHPYYKARFLLALFFIVNTETGLKAVLPPLPDAENKQKPEKENVLEIFIGANDTLIVEGEPEKLANLMQLTKKFLSAQKHKGIISLKNEKGTTYDLYVNVQDIIRAAYKEVRNEYALKTYNKPFDNLTEGQQETIRKIYPQRISEAELKDNSDY